MNNSQPTKQEVRQEVLTAVINTCGTVVTRKQLHAFADARGEKSAAVVRFIFDQYRSGKGQYTLPAVYELPTGSRPSPVSKPRDKKATDKNIAAQFAAESSDAGGMRKVMIVNQKKKVSDFQAQFLAKFGVKIRVYKGRRLAGDVAMHTLTPMGSRGGEMDFHGKTLVKNIKKAFKNMLGLTVRVENKSGGLADNNATLASLVK